MSSDDQEYYVRIFQDVINNAHTGDDHFATTEETAELVGFTGDELNAMVGAIMSVTQHMLGHAAEEGKLDTDDHEEMYNAICANTAANTMILLNALRKKRQKKVKETVAEKYPVTVLAEAHIRNMLADQADLNTVWPLPLAEEVVKEFDPTHAFMVGVVCGSTNG